MANVIVNLITRYRDEGLRRLRSEAGNLARELGAGLGLAAVSAAAANFGKESFMAAAQVERLEKASEALGKRYGVTSAQIVQSIQDVSDHTISQQAALEATNKAMLLSVIKSQDDFKELAEIAIVLGRAMGQDAKKSLDDITTALGRQSPLILDNLGIQLKLTTAYEGYAATLGKTADQLTKDEKQQAFLNEALKRGRDAVEEIGGVTLDTAGKVERLSARYADFQVSFGKLISDMGLLDAADFGLTKLDEGATAWSKFFDQVSLVTTAFSNISIAFDATSEKVNALGQSLSQLVNPLGTARDVFIELLAASQDGWDFIGFAQRGLEVLGQDLGDVATNTVKLITDENELGAAFAEAEEARRKATEATNAGNEATKEAIELSEEELKKLEELNKTRREFARELISIDEEWQDETAAAWKDYYDDLQSIEDDHADRTADIQSKSAKDRVKIQRKLQDDLAKVEKDLAKDLDKLHKDTAKNVNRKQEDFAKEQRNEERSRQIDTLADERLFQFELRQLEAEGQGNAIKAALERRAIEQQIASEKRAEEERQEQEKRSTEIDRLKEDERDRASELKAAAAERKQELQRQASEEEKLRQDQLAEDLANEQASFADRLAELEKYQGEKIAEIDKGRADAVKELGREFAEMGKLSEEELSGLAKIAGKFGVQAGEEFAKGLEQGAKTLEKLDELAGDLVKRAKEHGFVDPRRNQKATGKLAGFQSGGQFKVSGSGGPDSQLVEFMATPGEFVTITPPGEFAQGGIAGVDTRDAEAMGQDIMAAMLKQDADILRIGQQLAKGLTLGVEDQKLFDDFKAAGNDLAENVSKAIGIDPKTGMPLFDTQDPTTNQILLGHTGPQGTGMAQVSGGKVLKGMQMGGAFTVPPGFPNDSFGLGLTSGERVSVTPAGGNGGGNIFNLTVHLNGASEDNLVPLLEGAFKQFTDEVLIPAFGQ